MLKSRDLIQFRGRDGNIVEARVADVAVSPLSGMTRVRVVDYIREIEDPDAGCWIDATQIIREE